ncbi:MAG: stage III sporulation protein AE [Eubacterium ventriosum]
MEDSGKILKTQGYDNIDYKYILKKLKDGDVLLVLKEIGRTAYEKTIGDVSLIEKTLVNLLLITIIASFFTNFANVFSKNGISDTGFYICYMVTVAIMVTMFEEFSIIVPISEAIIKVCWRNDSGVFFVGVNSGTGGSSRFLSVNTCDY